MFGWFGKVSFVSYTKVADFAVKLKEGHISGSKCRACGFATFPPRADCSRVPLGRFRVPGRERPRDDPHLQPYRGGADWV